MNLRQPLMDPHQADRIDLSPDHQITINPSDEHKSNLSLDHTHVHDEPRTVATISDAQVIAAQQQGQEINIKIEDSKALRFIFNVGFPVFNHFVSEGIKRWIENYQGPMEETPFGEYGNSIYDAAMPQVLTVIEAIAISTIFKTPKFVTEQIFATAGGVAAGAFMQGLHMNTQMASSGIAAVGREATRAFVGGVTGWVTKHMGMFAINAATADKKVVHAHVEQDLHSDEELREQTFTTRP